MNHSSLVTFERDSALRTLFAGDRLVEEALPFGSPAIGLDGTAQPAVGGGLR